MKKRPILSVLIEAASRVLGMCVLVAVCALGGTGEVSAQARAKSAPTSSDTTPTATRDKMNDWTIGLAAGLPDGGFVRFASELARTLDDGDEMRVIPMVTRGTTSNIADLLYLRGVDIGITYADAFEFYKSHNEPRAIEDRIRFISQFFVSDVHIYARDSFKSLADLRGQKVAVGTPAVAAALTGPLIFSRLGIEITQVPIGGPLALEQLRKGEIAAMVYVAAKPSELFSGMKAEPGFHFLPIPYSEKFEDYYYPSRLTEADYPAMLAGSAAVETIAVASVLASYNWPRNSERGRRVDRFVDAFFTNFDKLKRPPFHPKWKEINLAATVPSWKRYPYAETVLARLKAKQLADQAELKTAPKSAGAMTSDEKQRFEAFLSRQGTLPKTDSERDRLYQAFLDWSRSQPATAVTKR